MAVLDRDIYKLVEYHLYSYHRIKERVEDFQEDVLFGQGGSIEPGGHGTSRHSDPTALKALKLTNGRDINTWLKWVKVTEQVMHRYRGTAKARLIQLRYFEEASVEMICARLHVDRSTYFDWVNEVVVYAALLGVQYGLVRIDVA